METLRLRAGANGNKAPGRRDLETSRAETRFAKLSGAAFRLSIRADKLGSRSLQARRHDRKVKAEAVFICGYVSVGRLVVPNGGVCGLHQDLRGYRKESGDAASAHDRAKRSSRAIIGVLKIVVGHDFCAERVKRARQGGRRLKRGPDRVVDLRVFLPRHRVPQTSYLQSSADCPSVQAETSDRLHPT